jgi:hypothetical protein
MVDNPRLGPKRAMSAMGSFSTEAAGSADRLGWQDDVWENYNPIIEPLFSLADKGAHLPRYHFVVTWRDKIREYGNTEGTMLQDEEEARRFAARVIRELKQAGEHDDPELCMVVKDAQEREVFTLSF